MLRRVDKQAPPEKLRCFTNIVSMFKILYLGNLNRNPDYCYYTRKQSMEANIISRNIHKLCDVRVKCHDVQTSVRAFCILSAVAGK